MLHLHLRSSGTAWSSGAPAPISFLDKVERLQQAQKTEEKWLASASREVTAREDRVEYFQSTLEQACAGEWDSVFGYYFRIPSLPSRPPTCRIRKVPRSIRTSTADRVCQRKRSASCAPIGVKRPASGRTETGDINDRRETEHSRRPHRDWPRRSLVSRRRSESRAPSTARVHREEYKHRSLGRVSKESAKKGRISNLLYDTVQEEKLLVRCARGG